MRLLQYLLAKLNAMPSGHAQRWLGLRISYGMNGILLRSEDLKVFAKYMRCAVANRSQACSAVPCNFVMPCMIYLQKLLMQALLLSVQPAAAL